MGAMMTFYEAIKSNQNQLPLVAFWHNKCSDFLETD